MGEVMEGVGNADQGGTGVLKRCVDGLAMDEDEGAFGCVELDVRGGLWSLGRGEEEEPPFS
jgi:hypothetical protein